MNLLPLKKAASLTMGFNHVLLWLLIKFVNPYIIPRDAQCLYGLLDCFTVPPPYNKEYPRGTMKCVNLKISITASKISALGLILSSFPHVRGQFPLIIHNGPTERESVEGKDKLQGKKP